MTATMPVLDIRGLTMDFGGLRAIDTISIQVNPGEIVALIGPNGAGKTTFFNCITGIYEPTRGDMIINPPGKASRRINKLKPNIVTKHGLARTFQNITAFPEDDRAGKRHGGKALQDTLGYRRGYLQG